LIDRFGREVTHLRISVTSRCNYRCVFCHSEGYSLENPGNELDPRDWGFVASVASSLGIKYYKLTGGEPLVRSDIVEIVENIREYGGIVSLVTNGYYLDKYVKGLAEAGVEHINVSLHSLNPIKYREITGGDLDRVLNNLMKARDYGILIKIDYLVLSSNMDEYKELIDYAMKNGFHMNIIELIPLGMKYSDWQKLHVALDPITSYLEKISIDKKIRDFQSRPVYVLPNNIEITVVKGYCNPELCIRCTRLRMTPEGFIKTCIFKNDLIKSSREHILKRDIEGFKNDIYRAVEIREPFFKPSNNIKLHGVR